MNHPFPVLPTISQHLAKLVSQRVDDVVKFLTCPELVRVYSTSLLLQQLHYPPL